MTSFEAHSGLFSATDLGNKSIRQNFDPIPTEDILQVSFWLKQPEIAISFVTFFYSDGTDGGGLVFLSTPDWEFFGVTALLAPGKALTGWGLFGYSGDGPDEDRSFLDDAQILVIPAPAGVWLLGLAAVRPCRRRK